MPSPFAQHFDAAAGRDVEPAVVVDRHTVGKRPDSAEPVVTGATAGQRAEHAPVPYEAVSLNIPGDDVGAVRIADVQRLLIAAQLDAVRANHLVFDPDRSPAGWNVVNSRRQLWFERSSHLLHECLGLLHGEPGLSEVETAVAGNDHVVGPAEWLPLVGVRQHRAALRRIDDADSRRSVPRLRGNETASRVLGHAVRFVRVRDEHRRLARPRVHPVEPARPRFRKNQCSVGEPDWIVEAVVSRQDAFDRCTALDHSSDVDGGTGHSGRLQRLRARGDVCGLERRVGQDEDEGCSFHEHTLQEARSSVTMQDAYAHQATYRVAERRRGGARLDDPRAPGRARRARIAARGW